MRKSLEYGLYSGRKEGYKDVRIARSTVEQNPERRKDTYYPEPAISKEAQDEIKKILWNERMKAETKKDAERMKH